MKYSDFYGELICKGENTVRFPSLPKGDYASMKTQILRTICGALALIMLLFAVSCDTVVDLDQENSAENDLPENETEIKESDNITEKPTEALSEEELLKQQLEELMFLSSPMLKFTLKDDNTYSVKALNQTIAGVNGTIVIPETYCDIPVTEVKENAFSYCDNITAIILPQSITEVGRGAFNYMKQLTTVVLSENVTRINGSTFTNDTNLVTVVLGQNVTAIDQFAFKSCYNLEFINFPDTLRSIGNYAFMS